MRFSLKRLLTLMIVAACVSTLVGWILRARHDAYVRYERIGVLENREYWPYGWRSLVAEIEERAGRPFEDIRLYRYYDSWGGEEAFVKLRETPESFAEIVVDQNLILIDATHPTSAAFWTKVPQGWLSKADLSEYEMYSTPVDLREYSDGDLFVVLRDKEDNRLYVWHTFIF